MNLKTNFISTTQWHNYRNNYFSQRCIMKKLTTFCEQIKEFPYPEMRELRPPAILTTSPMVSLSNWG